MSRDKVPLVVCTKIEHELRALTCERLGWGWERLRIVQEDVFRRMVKDKKLDSYDSKSRLALIEECLTEAGCPDVRVPKQEERRVLER